MQEHWDLNHVYVRHPELFKYDFIRNSKLTMGLLEIEGKIEGLFGYFFYNENPVPDIGGMLWTVTKKANNTIPLSGVKLRDFVLNNVKHRFFGSPGAGLQTKQIYKLIGSEWIELDHFVGTFSNHKLPTKINFEGGILSRNEKKYPLFQITKFEHFQMIENKIFKSQFPEKDLGYLNWRYFEHPYNKYTIWLIEHEFSQYIVVTRIQKLHNELILRVVDFIGEPKFAPAAIYNVYSQSSKTHSLTYVDFVASGFDKKEFFKFGFVSIDFNDPRIYVPNLFEPLVERSTQVYANSYKGFENVTMVRGNGDQDRPNLKNI